jgi:hypothetical protein
VPSGCIFFNINLEIVVGLKFVSLSVNNREHSLETVAFFLCLFTVFGHFESVISSSNFEYKSL